MAKTNIYGATQPTQTTQTAPNTFGQAATPATTAAMPAQQTPMVTPPVAPAAAKTVTAPAAENKAFTQGFNTVRNVAQQTVAPAMPAQPTAPPVLPAATAAPAANAAHNNASAFPNMRDWIAANTPTYSSAAESWVGSGQAPDTWMTDAEAKAKFSPEGYAYWQKVKASPQGNIQNDKMQAMRNYVDAYDAYKAQRNAPQNVQPVAPAAPAAPPASGEPWWKATYDQFHPQNQRPRFGQRLSPEQRLAQQREMQANREAEQAAMLQAFNAMRGRG